jgi:hypothetical protein
MISAFSARIERKSFLSVCRDLGNGARQFHAGWTRADNDECEPGAARRRIRDTLGYFECVRDIRCLMLRFG